jgi:uncharacterized membrane protein YidH (DUF202 family)
MTTIRIISLIGIIGGLAPFSIWLARKTGHGYFMALGIIAALVGFGLMFYAAFREQTTEDKSEQVSPRAAVGIFCGVGLLIVFILIRALVH